MTDQELIETARRAMQAEDRSLVEKFEQVITFLFTNPDTASALRGKSAPTFGSAEYIRRQAKAFADGRKPRAPQGPTTVPDEMVLVILKEYFDVPQADLERVTRLHLLAMGAENLVGDLLERYLASILEKHGWIWCSGSMVRAADFIKPPDSQNPTWTLLQVKNRDNSENSSSSAIRDGRDIKKWHRSFSKRIGSNWAAFPEASLRDQLSEDGFKEFARNYLHAIHRPGRTV